MRKPLIILAGLFLALAAALAAALLLLDVNRFGPQIQAAAAAKLHRSVKLGPMSLKLFPPSIRIRDVVVGEAQGFSSTAPFLVASEVYVRLGLTALLNREIQVQSIRIVSPQVELVRNKDGVWNYESMKDEQKPAEAPKSASGMQFEDVEIEDGTIGLTDQLAGRNRSQFDHIDLSLHNAAGTLRADGKIHLPGKGTEEINFGGKGTVGADFSGKATLKSVSLAGLRAFLGVAGAQMAGVSVSGETTFDRHTNLTSAKGQLSLTDSHFPETAKIDFEARDDSASGLLEIPRLTAHVGGLNMRAHAQLKQAATAIQISGEIQTGDASVADLLKLAKLLGEAREVNGSGTLSASVQLGGTTATPLFEGSGAIRNASLTLPTLRKPLQIETAQLNFSKNRLAMENLTASIGNSHFKGTAAVTDFSRPSLDFAVDVDTLDTTEVQSWVVSGGGKAASATGSANGSSIRGSGRIRVGKLVANQIVLNAVKADCKLEDNIAHLSPLTANLFGGQETGTITVDNRTGPPTLTVETHLTNVDANALLSATSSVRNTLSGSLSGNAGLRLTAGDSQEVARGLNGAVAFQLTNGKLAGIRMMDEMSKVSKVSKLLGYKLASEVGGTRISKLAGTLQIKDGVASTNDLLMEFDGGSLSATGTIGLADQTLNLKATAVLTREVAQKSGIQISGLMSTVLANGKGELVIPVTVSGTFGKPNFSPDAGQMAKLKLGSLLPGKATPAGVGTEVKGLIQQQPVQGILDAFRKRK